MKENSISLKKKKKKQIWGTSGKYDIVICGCADRICAVEMYFILNLWRQEVNVEEVLGLH